MSAFIRGKVSKIIHNQFPFYETPGSLTIDRDEVVIPKTAIINNLYVNNETVENLTVIKKRLSGWQLVSFEESYKHKVENGISLFKQKLLNE